MHFYVYFIEPDVNVDDLVLVEGDILLSKEQAAIYYESGWDGLVKSEAWYPPAFHDPWDRRIPFKFSDHFAYSRDEKDEFIRKNIVESMQNFMQETCLSFASKTCHDIYYMSFEKSDG